MSNVCVSGDEPGPQCCTRDTSASLDKTGVQIRILTLLCTPCLGVYRMAGAGAWNLEMWREWKF
jgi:hypothetical protein